MCGIVGIAARGARIDPSLLRSATESLAHRGPDDSDSTILRPPGLPQIEIGLGHRRLSIIDLSPAGRQPMKDQQTGNWIVFNGEIYNFLEIRQELQCAGVDFQSRSDTEVLLKGYGAWGRGFLQRLRGIFSFAIWDARNSCLFLARDPMGVKPLYYSDAGAYFLFASEIRTLLKTGLVSRKVDPAGLLSFIKFGSVYEPHTIVEGISALSPGHCLVWENGSFATEKYWEAPSRHQHVSLPEAQELAAASLDESIRKQTVSDVPVGVFLSGGIDSSAITAVLSRVQRPVTFSVVFREPEFNEAEASRAVARHFNTDHHEIEYSAHEGLETSREAISAMDQPTIDGLNTYVISRVARDAGIKVVLSGLGGDELFCGYRSFRSVPRMERFLRFWNRVPGRTMIGNLLLKDSNASDWHRKARALATENGHLVHPYFLSRSLFTPAQARTLLHDTGPQAALPAQYDVLKETARMDPINRVSYLEARCYMLNTLLRDADVMSMAHGLELRVPLIDHRLAETLFSIPGAMKLHRTVPKPLLVNSTRPGLPDEIVYRPKQGFTFPFERWLRNEMRGEVEAGIGGIKDGPLKGAIDHHAAANVWTDFEAGRTSWSRPWAFHVLQSWCSQNQVSA